MKSEIEIFIKKYWHYTIYFLVMLATPSSWNYVLPSFLILLAAYGAQCWRNKEMGNFLFFLISLLFFSAIYMRQLYNIILIINLVSIAIHNKGLKSNILNKKRKLYIYLVISLGLIIYFSYFAFEGSFYRADKYLIIIALGVLVLIVDPKFVMAFQNFKSFIAGTWLSIPLLMINSTDPFQLTNTFFSEYLEISHVYYGMFLGFSILLFVYLYYSKFRFGQLLLYILIPLLALLHTGSRLALIATLLILLYLGYLYLKPKSFALLFTCFIVVFGFILNMPRFSQEMDKILLINDSLNKNERTYLIENSWDNSVSRYLTMEQSFQEIKKKPWTGVGFDRIKSLIYQRVKNNGYIYYPRINIHNQYIEFALALGIPFLIYFIVIFIFGYKISLNRELMLIFLAYIFILLMGESILERAKGISFFFLFALWIPNFKLEN